MGDATTMVYSDALKGTIREALDGVMSGRRKVVVETDMHIVKAYWVVDMVRVDIQIQKDRG